MTSTQIEMFKLNSMTNNFVDDVIERGKSLSMIGRLEKSMDDDQKDTVAKFELDYHEMTRKKSILKREFDQLSGQLTNLESQINNKRQILCKFDIFRDDDQDQNFDQDECKISTSAHPTVVEEFIKETTPGVWICSIFGVLKREICPARPAAYRPSSQPSPEKM
uniref:Uncharacterized protein n=1 Tax=Romanomermis culicivorax TaxID=13658 RepID=A0A915IES5_ROMCU